MVTYNLVKYCRLCNARFVVDKKFSRTVYCSSCQKKLNNSKSDE